MRAILLIALVVWGGCCRQQYPAQTSRHDSIDENQTTRYIERLVHDTVTVTLTSQSAERTAFDSTSHLETDYALSDASIDHNGLLHHTLRNKPSVLRLPVSVKQTERSMASERVVYRDRCIEIPATHHTSNIQRALLVSGALLWFSLVLWIGWRTAHLLQWLK